MPSTTAVASLAVVAALAASSVNAHVYLTEPLAEFKAGASKSSWVDQFSPPWTGEFKTGAQYAAAAKEKGYKDLRSFLEDKGPVCGNSLPDATPKAIPASGKISLASTIEHAGPCEVWFDDVLAFHDDDCEKTFGSATSFAVDFSKCSGSCMLRFYWLGLQDGGKRWQSYKNCVPLKGGSGASTPAAATKPSNGTAPSASTPETTTKKPSKATPAPEATTKKPSKATPTPDETTKKPSKATPAPDATTKKPAKATPAPAKDDDKTGGEASSGAKCNRRLRD